MKFISTKSIAVAAVFAGAALVGNVWAGSGCNYGTLESHQAKVPLIEEADVLADAQNAPDPKWLALQKRRELNAQVQSGTVIVPN